MLETLTFESFVPRAGELFRLDTGSDAVLELTLSEVEPLSRAAANVRRTPFSLTFHTPVLQPLPQAIYRLENEHLPALELFLVPLGPDAKGMRYEAIFT